MKAAWDFISTFWPLMIPYAVFSIVMGVIIQAVEKRWPRSRRRQLRKAMLPVVIKLRTLRNEARIDRKLQEARKELQSLKTKLRLEGKATR
jgi:hypothetical protein